MQVLFGVVVQVLFEVLVQVLFEVLALVRARLYYSAGCQAVWGAGAGIVGVACDPGARGHVVWGAGRGAALGVLLGAGSPRSNSAPFQSVPSTGAEPQAPMLVRHMEQTNTFSIPHQEASQFYP